MKIWPTTEATQIQTDRRVTKAAGARTTPSAKFKDLHEMYRPLDAHDDNRVVRLNEAVELLEKFQRAAMHYVMNVNELAREYLLKARYREDKENFFNSLKLESSHNVDSDLWQYSKNY